MSRRKLPKDTGPKPCKAAIPLIFKQPDNPWGEDSSWWPCGLMVGHPGMHEIRPIRSGGSSDVA